MGKEITMFAEFFSGFTAAELVALVAGSIYAILQVFVPALSPIEWIKILTKWEDLKVKIVVQGFFVLLSVLAMLVTGELAEVGFNLKELAAFFGIFYGWSQLAWETLKIKPNLRFG